ncbi:MAG: hypothetical protein ACKO81_00680 [Planctomycetota bacterium]
MKENTPSLFDAIRVVRFPDGTNEVPVYYSQTGRSHLKIGDVGVVIGNWPGNRLRIEAVDPSGAIDWQDHLTVDQIEIIPTTDAPYCRRRINEAWSWNLILNGGPIHAKARVDALNLARKVMAFARQNVEILVDRLTTSGYRFANGRPYTPPADDISIQLQQLSAAGVHVPIALEAWLTEVGSVDLCGSHPDWPRSACVGIFDQDSPHTEPWYSDPLVIHVDVAWLIEQAADGPNNLDSIEIAPDDVTKANVSGNGPISIACTQPAFDIVVIGQHGSFTLLSYLRHAFDWAGFPGFEFIPDAPTEMLTSLAKGLVRL